jgi:NADH:ubiquinone oxidoreductase subunit 6 (subunit J)
MLDIKYSVMHLKVYYYYLISGFLIMLIAFEFLALVGVDLPLNLDDTITVPYVNWLNVSIEVSSLTSLGSYLYTYFCPSFISAGVILLVAMIGAISLTLSGFEFSDKKQVLFQQVNSSAKYCLFYVR